MTTPPPGRDRPDDEESLVDEVVDEALALELEIEGGEAGTTPTIESAKRHLAFRVARVAVGSCLVLLGVALLVLPGPGWLTIAAGLLLLKEDIPFARRLEARVRARLPQDEDENISRWVVVLSVSLAVVTVGLSVGWVIRT
jgi:hypothetical protein